ncbi:AMP-binding protein [Mycobacterium sp.]|uniref:AMP-binding protein n=2 Tax=Mycobacterium sp. TaxID=1785 RepID=UPI003F9693AA
MTFNLAVVLRESRNAHPDKPLCHIADQNFSYAEVDKISGRIAASLRNLGVHRGDKVAVQLPNLPHFLFAYFGILKAGAVMVPLNPLMRAPEIRYHLRDSESRLLITFETSADEAVKGAGKIADLSTYVVNLPGNGQRPVGTKSFDELYLADDTGEIEPTNADDVAVITYTSGTTGKPRGAELTHHQLYVNCTANGQRFRFRDEDVSLAVLPMFHVFGLSSVLNVAVRFGGTLVLVPRFDAQTVVDELARHRCTIFSGVPTMYCALLQADTDGRDLSALRVGVSREATIPGEVIRAFEEKFPGVVIIGVSGLSETAPAATFNISAEQRKVLSIGKSIWKVAAWVVELPPGADYVERTTGYCVFAAVLLLSVGVLPWREEKYFGGQLDWVVLGKIGLLMAAVLAVLWAKRNVARSGRSINTVMAPALLLVTLYCGSSAAGAFLFGSLLSSVELSVRVLVVGFVVLTLIELVGPMIVISTLSRVLAAVAIWVAVTGTLSSELFPGRLEGTFPPIHPNDIAFEAAVPLVYFVWRTVNVDTSFVRLLTLIPLGVIIFLTQSRTTEAMTAMVVLSLIIRGTRHERFRLSVTTAAVVCVVFAVNFTDTIQHFGSRGGTSEIGSFGDRIIAWNTVLNMTRPPMQTLFGQGLANKFVPIAGHYWHKQLLDSSWFSAFIQAGVIGLVIVAALVIYAATQALRNARPASDLWLALVVFVGVRSIFESGLLDTATSFIVFMMVSMGAATQARHGSFSGGNHFQAGV